MTGIQSKNKLLDEIIYFCKRAKEPDIKKRYNMKQLQQLLINVRDMVRTEKMLGL
jgi:hypothetical protein